MGSRRSRGSIEFPFDSALSGAGTYPAPFSEELVQVSFHINDEHSLSFEAALYDVDIKKSNKGVTKVRPANFNHRGVVTYA